MGTKKEKYIKNMEYIKRNLYYKDGSLFYKESIGKNKAGNIAGSVLKNKRKQIIVNKTIMYQHVIIYMLFNGCDYDGEIDHIDGNPSNNRIENLRAVSHDENMSNSKKSREYGFKGVSWVDRDKNYMASYFIKTKTIYIGSFNCPYMAAMATFMYSVGETVNGKNINKEKHRGLK